ncbi:MAG TPA: hypothetical protein ENI97_09260 [Gammaproteobacteria bacterium]|nr:hypothetical protein [Gammaproteobacteria bacterium]
MTLPLPKKFTFTRDGFDQVERIETPNGKAIAIIAKRPDSTFTHFIYTWDTTDFDYIGEGYWNEYESGSIFDSIESARPSVLEDLQCMSGEKLTSQIRPS